jgi:hypothetical protein
MGKKHKEMGNRNRLEEMKNEGHFYEYMFVYSSDSLNHSNSSLI